MDITGSARYAIAASALIVVAGCGSSGSSSSSSAPAKPPTSVELAAKLDCGTPKPADVAGAVSAVDCGPYRVETFATAAERDQMLKAFADLAGPLVLVGASDIQCDDAQACATAARLVGGKVQ